jgi:hypothetical protein
MNEKSFKLLTSSLKILQSLCLKTKIKGPLDFYDPKLREMHEMNQIALFTNKARPEHQIGLGSG